MGHPLVEFKPHIDSCPKMELLRRGGPPWEQRVCLKMVVPPSIPQIFYREHKYKIHWIWGYSILDKSKYHVNAFIIWEMIFGIIQNFGKISSSQFWINQMFTSQHLMMKWQSDRNIPGLKRCGRSWWPAIPIASWLGHPRGMCGSMTEPGGGDRTGAKHGLPPVLWNRDCGWTGNPASVGNFSTVSFFGGVFGGSGYVCVFFSFCISLCPGPGLWNRYSLF